MGRRGGSSAQASRGRSPRSRQDEQRSPRAADGIVVPRGEREPGRRAARRPRPIAAGAWSCRGRPGRRAWPEERLSGSAGARAERGARCSAAAAGTAASRRGRRGGPVGVAVSSCRVIEVCPRSRFAGRCGKGVAGVSRGGEHQAPRRQGRYRHHPGARAGTLIVGAVGCSLASMLPNRLHVAAGPRHAGSAAGSRAPGSTPARPPGSPASGALRSSRRANTCARAAGLGGAERSRRATGPHEDVADPHWPASRPSSSAAASSPPPENAAPSAWSVPRRQVRLTSNAP